MDMKKTCFLTTLTLLCFFGVYSQNEKLKYIENINVSNGLAHNGVTCVLEDSRGFIWFGTFGGLNKYDGYIYKTYKNKAEGNLLKSNRVRSLEEDTRGNIWIGTEKGITIYDYEQDSFVDVSVPENIFQEPIFIRDIFVDEINKLIFCCTQNDGVIIFNEDYTFRKNITPSFFGEVSDKLVFVEGIKLSKDYFLFGTNLGLFSYNLSNDKFDHSVPGIIKECLTLKKVRDNTILAALNDGIGVLKYKILEGELEIMLDDIILNNNRFSSIDVDLNDNLWLGELNHGIFQLSSLREVLEKKTFKIVKFDDSRLLRSSGFLLSTTGYCWFATFNKGIYKFDLKYNPFSFLKIGSFNSKKQSVNNYLRLSPLSKDLVYFTSEKDGLVLFNTSNNQYEELPFDIGVKKSIRIVYVDSEKNLWMYAKNSSVVFRVRNGESRIEEITLPKTHDNGELKIRSFVEDKRGDIWITAGDKKDIIYKLILDEDNEISYKKIVFGKNSVSNIVISGIRKVYSDPSFNCLWIGTDHSGLFRVDNSYRIPKSKIGIDNYLYNKDSSESIPNNFITSIVRLPQGDLWIGTEGSGFCKLLESEKKPVFINYSEKDGLSNNVVKYITYDNSFNLWLGTDIGLNRFNPKTNVFQKFKSSDGLLPFDDFWYEGGKQYNNNLFFANDSGVCYFNPSEINLNNSIPNFQLDNFKVNGELIKVQEKIKGRVVLERNLNNTANINLNYDENTFSMDVSSLHFTKSENHYIKYKLLPLSKDWIKIPSRLKTIYFNDLRAANYKLHIKVSNDQDLWSSVRTMDIIVAPPFWKTKLAYFVYILLIILLMYFIINVLVRVKTLKYKIEIEIEKLEIENIKDINEEKLRFFSNISHEIKTPLTLILGPSAMLLERFQKNPDLGGKLELINRQAKKIGMLIEQVHDLRKEDLKALKMNNSIFNFNDFLLNTVKDFHAFSVDEKKNIEIINKGFQIEVRADRGKLTKILNNLIGNALKYTIANDYILIEFFVQNNNLILFISDTGEGIDEVDLPHVFERFYQSHEIGMSHKGGSGIGLSFTKKLVEMHLGSISVSSVRGEGTKFRVEMPIVHDNKTSNVEQNFVFPAGKVSDLSSSSIDKVVLDKIDVSDKFSNSLIYYVEDNNEMNSFVVDVLSNFYNVKSFFNGRECLDELNEEWPDLIISDVQMPVLNGLELCHEVKSNLKTSHIPVILLSALANGKNQIEGIREGADRYIEKPFDVEYLIVSIESLLLIRKSLKDRFDTGIPLIKNKNAEGKRDREFLDKLYRLLEENLSDQDFNLVDGCKELNLSRTLAFKKVKALTGTTPFEFLKNYRLEKSAKLLKEKQYKVSEVAIMTGFKSRSHFYKVFKNKYGVSPGEY